MKHVIDIIIPCYNAKDTLFETLCSISIQVNCPSFKVYLINDKSDYDYKEEVTFFSKFFPIEEITLEENVGPGGARREGINRTEGDFITFIDSDDIFYTCEALAFLFNAIENKDLVISDFIYERDGVVTVKEKNLIWLHGKMFRRSFLMEHNINFNDTRANEDNGFNRLVLLMNPSIGYIDTPTYVYRENENSITRKNNRDYKISGLEGFVYNMKWAIDEALKRGADKTQIPILANSILVALYLDYLSYQDDQNVNNILKYSKDMLEYYEVINKRSLNKMIKDRNEVLEKENRKVELSISFDEFIERVRNYD